MSGEQAAGAPLTVVRDVVGDRHVVTVRGELDAFTAPNVRAVLAEAGDRDVVIDLAGVTFIDSSGLAMIVETAQRLAAEERRLVVGPRSETVERLLELSGVASRLDLDPAP